MFRFPKQQVTVIVVRRGGIAMEALAHRGEGSINVLVTNFNFRGAV